MLNDYALIVSEETVSSMSDGLVQGKVAVCVVRSSVAEVHVVWPSEVDRLTSGLPKVPAHRGCETLYLEYEEEAEVLETISDAVRDEASRLSVGLPVGFMEVRPMLSNGLDLMFQEHGLDVRISVKLAALTRWKEGDAIAFGISPDGEIGVLCCEEAGTGLAASLTEIGSLEVSSYLALPSRFADYATDWQSVEYWVSQGRIYFAMNQFSVLEAEAPGSVDDPEPSTFVPAKSVLDSTFLHGIAAGSLSLVIAAFTAKLFT